MNVITPHVKQWQKRNWGEKNKGWLKRAGMIVASHPPSIPISSDCCYCPWCGTEHETVSFGDNYCEICRKGFKFGPIDDGVVGTFIEYDYQQFELMMNGTEDIPPFKPCNLLKSIYKHFEDIENER